MDYSTTSIFADCENASSSGLNLCKDINMETYSGERFLMRRGLIREPLRGLPYPFGGSHPRVVTGLMDTELDHLVMTAFDCEDTETTLRGMLRAAVDAIKPNILTSHCVYRIGFENNSTEITLLVTVLPGSLAMSEASQAITALLAVLERWVKREKKKKEPPSLTRLCSYDKRLGALAIEVAEQTISLVADRVEAQVELPSDTAPNEEIRAMSYDSFPSIGSSISLAGDQQGVGTLGAFLRIVTDGTPEHFALTCSHVLSSTSLHNNTSMLANFYSFQETHDT